MALRLRLQKGDIRVDLEIDITNDPQRVNAILSQVLQNIMSAMGAQQQRQVERESRERALSKYQRLKELILTHLRGQWFTSSDVKELFEAHYGEEIRSSTVSTYLRRLEAEGLLVSRSVGRIVEYRLADEVALATVPPQRREARGI